MKKIFGVLVAISLMVVMTSCSLLGGSTTPAGTASSGYPDSVVYTIKLPSETYLCSSYKINSTETGISLALNDVYSRSSDGKITWIGQTKEVSAVSIEKIAK